MMIQQDIPGTKRLGAVVVGLSGGVDSAVSAALLVEQGYEVEGVFLECWRAPGCRVDEDRRDAMDVALKLGIPFRVLDFKQAYREKVVEYFYAEYAAGRTPNPDTMCNKEIKFGMFYDWALANGFAYVATGHYAQIARQGDTTVLVRGVDRKKDQSYFLYQLRTEQLEHVLFPIGGMNKPKVREEAQRRELVVADKPDSQGICFIGPVSVKEFLGELGMKDREGVVVFAGDEQRRLIGMHDGAWFFTVGQRGGYRLVEVNILEEYGLDPGALPPLYVVSKDVDANELVIGTRDMLMRTEWKVEQVHLMVDEGTGGEKEWGVRIRHGGQVYPARVKLGEAEAMVQTKEGVFGIAPGQACVFYDGEVVMGGGVIG